MGNRVVLGFFEDLRVEKLCLLDTTTDRGRASGQGSGKVFGKSDDSDIGDRLKLQMYVHIHIYE